MTTLTFGELLNATNLRKIAARTVETYPVPWKVVHETLQNAKDAIRHSGKQGTIDILLDVANQSVTVKDSGSGFPRDNELLGFGGTDKDDDPDWCLNGRQGVGLKSVILSSKYFSIDAVHKGERWSLRIEDADKFVEGGNPTFAIDELGATNDPSGTEVTYSFRDTLVSQFVTEVLTQQIPYVTEYLASNDSEQIAIALESYFRSYSYAGDLNATMGLGSPVGTNIKIQLVAASAPLGSVPGYLETQLKSGRIECEFKSGLWDLTEAVGRTKPRRNRPAVLSQSLPPGGTMGRFNENYVYVKTFTSEAEYRQLLDNPNLRRPADPSKYESLFRQLRGVYVAIGSASILSRYLIGSPRQFIAADGTPTAHVLPGPTRGGDASYVSNNIHFVANIDAKLNYGKQTVSNTRLVGLVAEYFSEAVRATLRNVAISFVGSMNISSSGHDLDIDRETEKDVISRPTLANGLLHFKRIPRDENALIAIFFEILGRGDLPGYHFYSISQKAKYDGRATAKLVNTSDMPTPDSDTDLHNIEFKLELEDLIDDFEHEVKTPSEIQLVVVWNDTIRSSITDYQVLDIDYTPDADRRMHGVEKVLHCKLQNRMIQMVVVQDLSRELVTPDNPS